MKIKHLLIAALAVLGVSTASAKEDVTNKLTNPTLANNEANWRQSSNGGNHAYNNNGYWESWHNTFKLEQTVSNLPEGYYQLTIQAQIEGGSTTTAVLTAKSGSNTATACPNSKTGSNFAEIAATMKTIPQLNRISATVKVEEGGSLTATFEQTGNNQWMVYGNFQLYKLTDTEGQNQIALEEKLPKTNWAIANAGGGYKGLVEYYIAGEKEGEVLTNTLTGLPNGKYNVSVSAAASYTSGRGFSGKTGDDITVAFANGVTKAVPVLDRGGVDYNAIGIYELENAVVSDGTLKFGLKNLQKGSNWFIYGINTITYLGEDISDYEESFNQAKTALIQMDATKAMNNDVKAVLVAAQGKYQTKDFSDYTKVKDVTGAIAEMNGAVNNANASIAVYTAIAAINTKAAALDADGQAAYAPTLAKYNDGTIATVAEAEDAFVAATKAQTSDNADMTGAVLNPGAEVDGGWTMVRDGSTVTLGIINNSGNAHSGNRLFETAGWGPKAAEMAQTISGMPNGKYELEAYFMGAAETVARLSVNGTVSEEPVAGSGDKGTDRWKKVTAVGEVVDGTLTIKALSNTESSTNWANFDDFKLTLVHKFTPEEIKKAELKAAIDAVVVPTTNVGDGAFQYSSTAIADINAKKTVAQAVYDNEEATVEQIDAQIAAMEAVKIPALTVPADGQKFNISITYAGYRYNGHPLEPNATITNGIAVPLANHAGNANRFNAFTFTPVDGVENGYTVSITDAENTIWYICTGAQDNGNNDQQVRMTNDASKALTIVVKATETEGIYNLINTRSSNATLGCQDDRNSDGGLYTTPSHNTIAITEASKATATLAVSAAKWATFIAPFDVEIPEGVTVYDASAENEGVITREEQSSIKANTPYILYAEEPVNVSVSGWGLAKDNTYTAGLLTGVYVDTPAVEGSYILQNQAKGVGFYQVQTAGVTTVGANRAYLTLPAASAKPFIGIIDAPTGVVERDADAEDNTPAYNVGAMLVGKNAKGLIIKAGKKTFVK